MDERSPMERVVSTDVVMDIVLSHLKVRDLLNCRKVSNFWNKGASSVLRKRSTMIKWISSEAELMKLKKCLRQYSDFPFAGFNFDQSWMLNCPRVQQFLKNYGPRFTSLNFRTSQATTVEDLAQFVNHFSRLSILEVDYSWNPPQAAVFVDSAAGQEGGQLLNLPSLRTLKISSEEFNEDVLRQVLREVPSSKLQIEVMKATHEILSALNSAGRLQAVTVLGVQESGHEGELALLVDELLLNRTPVLTKLYFEDCGCISRGELMKLLISSQHHLQYLSLDGIYPSELLSEYPVLTKLTGLTLLIFDHSCEYIFQGRQGHKFPALKELKLYTFCDEEDCLSVNISDGLFTVASQTTVALDGFVYKHEIKELAGCFPNVMEIRLDYQYYRDDPSDIWSVGAFKCLEKLTIWGYPVQRPSKKYMNMDRFLTGMPTAVCNNLRTASQQNLIDSPFNEILRGSPSILQLENLKKLIVCVKLKCGLKEFPEETPFISMVSMWYALDMMPNLEARFVYEHNSPFWRFQAKNRDKAVSKLKAVLKHVQPYVELEPFYR